MLKFAALSILMLVLLSTSGVSQGTGAGEKPPAITGISKEVVKILENGEDVPFFDRVKVESDGRKVFTIHKNEVVEFVSPKKPMLGLGSIKDGSEQAFQIVNGRVIVGMAVGAESELKIDNETVWVRVVPTEINDVTTTPTFLSYKIVKDAFGRGVANYFLVVQVNIENNSPSKQYLVKNLSVYFDPKQCDLMNDYYSRLKSGPSFNLGECNRIYERYFRFPTDISLIDRENIMGVAETEKYRSKRFILFKSIDFISSVGTALGGFNLLGKDAIKGFAYLGSGFKDAGDAALPKLAEEKFARLSRSIPEENVIVANKNFKTMNIFIPADRIFNFDSWNLYRRSFSKEGVPDNSCVKNNKLRKNVSDDSCVEDVKGMNGLRDNSCLKGDKNKSVSAVECIDSTAFRRYLHLFLLATSSGVFIDNSNEKKSNPGGGAETIIKNARRM